MRHVLRTAFAVALLLTACGAPQSASLPHNAPTTAANVNDSAAPGTTTETASASPTAVPQPTMAPTLAATETPQPPEPTAPPTVEPTPEPAPAAAEMPVSEPTEPTRLVIDAIGIDRELVSVGLDENRVPVVPNHDVGWYNLSAMPGQGENIVLWGHVLRFKSTPHIPAPFARVKELEPGAAVVLYDAQGNAHNYVVTQQIRATPDQVEYILPQGQERVTLVSCIGDKVVEGGEVEMTHRLITIAELAS